MRDIEGMDLSEVFLSCETENRMWLLRRYLNFMWA